jgi:hypothetical protein
VIRHDGVVMSAVGEEALRREKGGDDTCWTHVNLTGLKNEENSCSRFSYYKWEVKI